MNEVNINVNDLSSKLKDVTFFKYLKDEELKDFIKSSQLFEYNNNEKIIIEGEISSYLYILISGVVNVTVNQKGADIYITTLGEGSVVGEAAIFVNFKRTASIGAFKNVEILRIERTDFIEFIKRNPSSGIKMLMVIIHTLLTKLNMANQELSFERTTHVDQGEIDKFIESYFTTI
jgi:CRP/FNR family transcriptional regulator, cyclic AMP receptor protein